MRVDPAPPVQIRTVTLAAALPALVPAWERLVARCPRATPFHTPAWLLPALDAFGADGLWVLSAWRGGELAGLAPFQVTVSPEGTRQLGWVASGITDYHGTIIEPDDAGRDTAARMASFLMEARGTVWDRAILDQLAPGEPLTECAPAGPLAAASVERSDVCPYVPLPHAPELVDEHLPRDLGAWLRRCVRRLGRAGALELRMATAATLDRDLDALFKLHAARWAARGQEGVLAGHSLQSFHRAVARAMYATGRLRMFVLLLDDVPRAVVYAFASRHRYYSYLGGFDPALGSFSPGLVLLRHAMMQGAAEGMDELDLLRGGEEYKYRLGARDRWNARLVLGQPGLATSTDPGVEVAP